MTAPEKQREPLRVAWGRYRAHFSSKEPLDMGVYVKDVLALITHPRLFPFYLMAVVLSVVVFFLWWV